MSNVLRAGLIWGVLLGITGAAPARQTPKPEVEPDLTVTLRVYDYAHLRSDLLDSTLEQAKFLLAQAGVVVAPVVCSQGKSPPVCKQPLDPPSVVLRIVTDFDPGLLSDALGFATGQYVAVAYSRVHELAGGSDIVLGKMLGCVVAHEIGHVLLGPDAHSASGIMTAHYTEREWMLMENKLLWFLPAQAARMQANVRSRQQEAPSPMVRPETVATH